MKNHFTKISLFILIGIIVSACNSTKRVPDGKRLLTKTEIEVDNAISKNEDDYYQLYQKPNSSIPLLNYRFRLNLFNLAKQNSDSIYKSKFIKNPEKYFRKSKWLSKKQVNRLGHSFWYEGFNNFLKKTGEAPVIIDTNSTKKSIKRLNYYFYNKGYFDVNTTTITDTTESKKINLKYIVNRGNAYLLDTINPIISTPALDSLFKKNKQFSILKNKNQYSKEDLNKERNRITADFRNNGAFFFQQNYISYEIDTINTKKKVNLDLIIKDQNITLNDTSKTMPFKLYKINKVNVFTDHTAGKSNMKSNDSLYYNGFYLYSIKKIKYRPKSVTDAIFITKGSLYSDNNSILTSKYLSNLKVFNYPSIQYAIDPKDENGLVANVYLTPRKKYVFGASADFTHSTIQDFGISGNASLGINNVFNGAETFEIGFRGNVGASKDNANPNNTFFNISEIGIDSKLNFPRLLFPFKTDKIIPKSMIPYTTLSVGYAKQTNIGLDKQNFTSSFSYNWTPKKNATARFDLLNIQFVKNDNVANYFNIYKSSHENLSALAINYNADIDYFYTDESGRNLLKIEDGTSAFLNDVLGTSLTPISTSEVDLKTIRSINERRLRLTENNLIFATSFSFSKSTKNDLKDDNFFAYKYKVESAGSLLAILARASKQLKQQSGANTFFDVEFSQYIKSEVEYIKHWDLNQKKVFAFRSFVGIAIPYGNSKSIPFSRSYFAGGTNDIRAWQPYSLGPGSSGGINDFNEANMKMSFNAELRFNIFDKVNGALFADAGNIWNFLDNIEDEKYQFRSLKSLKNIALGTGFGIRYDFDLFILRADLGLKTYNPANIESQKWFKELNLSKSVINIGINYPF